MTESIPLKPSSERANTGQLDNPKITLRFSRDERANLIRKMAGKPGLRGKIDAKCCDCTYDPLDSGTWRKQVENCAIVDCSLHSVRPQAKGRDLNIGEG